MANGLLMNNYNRFKETYTETLKECKEKFPEDYHWDRPTTIHSNTGIVTLPCITVDVVVERMMTALMNNTAGKGRALTLTCKKLKIKDSFKAIKEYIN
jgi:hypothetical protein